MEKSSRDEEKLWDWGGGEKEKVKRGLNDEKSFWPGGAEHERYHSSQKQVFIVPTVFEMAQCQVVGNEESLRVRGDDWEVYLEVTVQLLKGFKLGSNRLILYFRNFIMVAIWEMPRWTEAKDNLNLLLEVISYHAPIMSWGQCIGNGMDNMFPKSISNHVSCFHENFF